MRLNNVEVIVFLLLLFMGVPDVCRKLGRPGLGFPIFVIIGLLLGPVVNTGVQTMLVEAGMLGFILLLFEVGSEVDLPRLHELVRPGRTALALIAAQYPLIMAAAQLVGLGLVEGLVAATALTSCSVGMAHTAWKNYPMPTPAAKTFILHVMVLLELVGVLLLAVETVVIERGFSWWVPLRLSGILVTVLLLARFATHVNKLFQTVLATTTQWRVHFLVLVVLAICALGERVGLSAAKTAFVLGLCLGRIEHGGKGLEEYIAPVSHGFLIPLFFVALGLQLPVEMLFSRYALLALGMAALLLGFRSGLHRRWLKTGGDSNSFLLLAPNLTIVALAANSLLQHHAATSVIAWLLMTGLFVTMLSLFLLPRVNGTATEAARTT
jgi:Kef-type K+ transport system membrane component KefB